MTSEWDLDVHKENNAFDNNDVLDNIHDKVSPVEYFQNKRNNAKNFGTELDDLRIT